MSPKFDLRPWWKETDHGKPSDSEVAKAWGYKGSHAAHAVKKFLFGSGPNFRLASLAKTEALLTLDQPDKAKRVLLQILGRSISQPGGQNPLERAQDLLREAEHAEHIQTPDRLEELLELLDFSRGRLAFLREIPISNNRNWLKSDRERLQREEGSLQHTQAEVNTRPELILELIRQRTHVDQLRSEVSTREQILSILTATESRWQANVTRLAEAARTQLATRAV